jgi:hypothetical protein
MLNLLAQAANTTINLRATGDSNTNTLMNLTVPGIVGGAVKFVVIIAALIFFFILVIGGIKWIASGGDKAKTEEARNQITAALVGLVIVFASWAIVALINAFFNVNIFNLVIPNATSAV